MSPGVRQDIVSTSFPEEFGVGPLPLNSNISKETRLVSRKFSYDSVTMDSLYRKSLVLCGVTLTDDWGYGKSSEFNRTIVSLGTVCVDDVRMKLEDLRLALVRDVSCVPENFLFVSKEGWSLSKKQEGLLKASHVISDKNVISIKKHFEKQKLGVAVSGGDPLGFVFADLNISVKQLRDLLEQLKISQQLKMEYKFVERNGWPVMASQEMALTLPDIILGQVIYVQSQGSIAEVQSGSKSISTKDDDADTGHHERPDESTGRTNIKNPSRRGKDVKDSVCQRKSILLSYVRADAAQYAIDLKKELVHRGLGVYLDVDEIKVANDWQDSLNAAVANCFMFVPLITPNYGQTRWTNREIKLADYMQKVIVPVNFMEIWPPSCLAIQFASKQYIPWKILDNEHGVRNTKPETCSDRRIWPKVHVERVAKVIADCYKENYGPVRKRSIKKMSSFMQPRGLASPILPKEDVITPLASSVFGSEPIIEKNVIVICAHPKQRLLSHELRTLFENDGHMVWCSDDWQEGYETLSFDDRNSVPNTPRDLPTIAENEVFFSQHDHETVLTPAGSCKKFVPPIREVEAYGRRPLSRLLSQFSDINQALTLNQEQVMMLSTFQKKVDQAGVIIFLVSEDYTKSAFSQEQVFYCEHRKKVVLVKCDDSIVPAWFTLLMRNDMIMKAENPQFECVLKARVKRALNPSSSETPKDATFEAKLKYLVNFLKCNLPLKDMPVYITGSSKLQNKRSEEICRALGHELSKIHNMSVVTGGCFGVPDITAKAFFEQRENTMEPYVEDTSVVHILPMHESQEMKSKARQNPDGTFEVIPFGRTFFIGDNLKERETVVARLLDICVVIEGGPGVVHEVEEFIWNDHFVIPIQSTGGAAGGKYGIPMKIFELPNGVDAASWSTLSDADASPETVAKAVVDIILSLKKAVSTPVSTMKSLGFLNQKRQRRIKMSVHDPRKPTTLGSIHKPVPKETPQDNKADSLEQKRKRWWQKIMHH